ncbi:GntR family transcriptional regulator [Pseudothauera nasutitermitis]|uniref:GntR family transcriptional regulator n=1 Tax=Pseudothauera nasutitermitis TaxID=2565930 RepID=A0A4S4B049_9RHOO|nr:GntR family transcriptional regulator [Pseudothauera nasutitermitis]THF65848.1 GntR family transcriptional regulator [Pseudothauera nasutitermitis]
MPPRHFPHPGVASSLPDSVAEAIRQKLIHGELCAGQRLSEAQLAEQLDVSRNTLREAFRILSKEGLVHHAPNRGVSVVIPSIADIIDIYRIRRLIECQALAQSWPRHPAHKRMRQAVEQARQARAAGDWLQVGSANMAFHGAIVALADSERLSAMFSDIAAELRLAFGLLNDPEYLHAPYVDQNAHLLQLFEDGRIAEAAVELENYLVQSERMVLAVYARRVE